MEKNLSLQEIFTQTKSIAVVGMSRAASKVAHSIPLFLLHHGYTIFPVNPYTTEIAGLQCYPTIEDIPQPIDMVNVFRPSAAALAVIAEAVARRQKHGDVKVIWLQSGIISKQGALLARTAGIIYLEDRCIYQDYLHTFH